MAIKDELISNEEITLALTCVNKENLFSVNLFDVLNFYKDGKGKVFFQSNGFDIRVYDLEQFQNALNNTVAFNSQEESIRFVTYEVKKVAKVTQRIKNTYNLDYGN